MRLADGIRKHGFRKWYERELRQSHVRLFLLLCTGIGIWALRRFIYLLMHAEAIASQAVRPACESYGSLQLVQDDECSERVKVKCRGCEHEWHIQDSGPG